MCGIAFALQDSARKMLPMGWEEVLEDCGRRGPDINQTLTKDLYDSDGLSKYRMYLYASVLHMRGGQVTRQPWEDKAGNVLLWNGEVFGGPIKVGPGENDTERIGHCLHELGQGSREERKARVGQILCRIEGPFAFVYYEADGGRIWFGRDALGRRSLLTIRPKDEESQEGSEERMGIFLASVAPDGGGEGGEEVEAGQGVFYISISEWMRGEARVHYFPRPEPLRPINVALPCPEELPDPQELEQGMRTGPDGTLGTFPLAYQQAMQGLYKVMYEAVSRRLTGLGAVAPRRGEDGRVAILFSGGVDCTTLAVLVDQILGKEEAIDLINVAFENPRELRAQGKVMGEGMGNWAQVPDRKTGKTALMELARLSPNREWRWIEVNVEYWEVEKYRERVEGLMRPSRTRMDLSIALAFWFATRGKGTMWRVRGRDGGEREGPGEMYTSKAKVVMLGSGADEQLGGYSRHREAYERGGWERLVEEVQLDVSRISKRNFGRDDRMISDHGKESRLPFTDGEVMSYLGGLPIQIKCDPRLGRGKGEKLVLRGMGMQILGLGEGVWGAPKRAIQFGARSAKMHGRWEKGDDVI